MLQINSLVAVVLLEKGIPRVDAAAVRMEHWDDAAEVRHWR